MGGDTFQTPFHQIIHHLRFSFLAFRPRLALTLELHLKNGISERRRRRFTLKLSLVLVSSSLLFEDLSILLLAFTGFFFFVLLGIIEFSTLKWGCHAKVHKTLKKSDLFS